MFSMNCSSSNTIPQFLNSPRSSVKNAIPSIIDNDLRDYLSQQNRELTHLIDEHEKLINIFKDRYQQNNMRIYFLCSHDWVRDFPVIERTAWYCSKCHLGKITESEWKVLLSQIKQQSSSTDDDENMFGLKQSNPYLP